MKTLIILLALIPALAFSQTKQQQQAKLDSLFIVKDVHEKEFGAIEIEMTQSSDPALKVRYDSADTRLRRVKRQIDSIAAIINKP